jgi:hypothetical protein
VTASGRGAGIVGNNVQAAVDTKHYLIVTCEVTHFGHRQAHLRTNKAGMIELSYGHGLRHPQL